MSDSLTYIDKCLVASMAAVNASYLSREGSSRSASNAAIETMKIKTLAEYYNAQPERLRTYNPEKMDNNKLMRTYVIPLVLDNGEQIDLIVNSKGQDMACVYLDEDSNEHMFELTPRMKEAIEIGLKENGINGIETKLDFSEIKNMMEPKNLEEFTRAVEKDNLVPKSPRDTVARIKNVDEDADIQVKDDDDIFEIENEEEKSPEEIQEEISLEEDRLKEIAEKVGMNLDDMKRFCKENKLTSKTIKGAIEVVNVDALENILENRQLSQNGSGSVIIIKTEENNMQQRARITGKDGKTILDNPKYDEKMVDLVPERTTTEPIRDLDEYKEETKEVHEIEYADGTGEVYTAEVEGNEADAYEFEEKIAAMIREYKEKLTDIENNSNLDVRTVSQLKEDMAADFYAGVCQLSRETGVQATEVRQDALADAEQAVEDNAKTQLMEDVKDVGGVLGGLVGADALMDSAYDERDPNYGRLNGRQPRGLI